MADRRRLLAALAVSLVAAGCSWSQIGFDASHNSSNPLETGLTTENVTSLRLGWQTTTAEGGPPIIAAGFVFITNVQVPQLEAYSAVGSTNCAGTPKTCGPVWTAPISSGSVGGPAAFADGKVFVSATGNGQWHLEGFDANGNTNCSGAPKVCRPMWTASWGSSVADAAGTRVSAAAGRVYVDASGHPVTAFDATGAANCTTGNPRVCTPLFTAPAAVYQGLVFSTVAVGRLFVPADGGKTQVFDANGRSGCTNGLCSPLYALATPGHVSVSGSLAYAIAAGPGPLQVFDATGQRGCSGTPRLCQPIWTAPIAGAALGGWPAVAAMRARHAVSSTREETASGP